MLLAALSQPLAALTVWTRAEGVLASCRETADRCPPSVGRTRYLSPGEDDCSGQRGSRSCPFTDRTEALAALAPGDTLVLLQGVHSLIGGWTVEDVHGTPCQPITLQAEEGAVLSAEIESAWRRADRGPDGRSLPSGLTVFETSLEGVPLGAGILGMWDVDGLGPVALSDYGRWSDFVSTTEELRLVDRSYPSCADGAWTHVTGRFHDGELYTGPGYFVDRSGDVPRIFLRLDPTATMGLLGLAGIARDPSRAHLYLGGSQLRFWHSSHLALRDLDFRYAEMIEIGGGAHHLDFERLSAVGLPRTHAVVRVWASTTRYRTGACAGGVACETAAPELCTDAEACLCSSWRDSCVLRSAAPHHIRLRNVRVDAGFPPWVFWTDLKWGSAVPASEGVCGGWSFLEGQDIQGCDCNELGDPPADQPIFKITTTRPGRATQHGPLIAVGRESPAAEGRGWPFPPSCVEIDAATLEDGWFGVYAVGGEKVRVAGSEIRRIHDDAVLIGNQAGDVEVGYNTIVDVFSAFSSTGAADLGETGDVFIHHNVVDMSGDGPPARERIACVRPGGESSAPAWNVHDVDGDGVRDGFCSNLVQAGHTVWGMRWEVYANTLLVDNAQTYGALSSVKQSPQAPEPAHFVGNVLVQEQPGRPLYGDLRYDRFEDDGRCAASPRGLQITDGNIYWRAVGEGVVSACPEADCCDALDSLPDQETLFFHLQGPGATHDYPTLAHFRCGIAGGQAADLATLSACGHDLDYLSSGGPEPGVNEGVSLFRDPRISVRRGYRPSADVAARVRLPTGWPDADWPWIGARAPEMGEDCVSFDPSRVTVERLDRGLGAGGQRRFRLVDGSHGIRVFADESEALRALEIVRRYRMDQSCFVGRPNPSFSYLLTDGRAPVGAMDDEDCLPLAPDRLAIEGRGRHWGLVDGPRRYFSFDREEEALETLEIIRAHRFRQSCFVGRPDPSFSYLRR